MFGETSHILPLSIGSLLANDRSALRELIRERQTRDNFIPSEDPGIEWATAACRDWLFRSQDSLPSADGAFADHYSFLRGWAAPTQASTAHAVRALIRLFSIEQNYTTLKRSERGLSWLMADAASKPTGIGADETAALLRVLIAATRQFGEHYLRPTLKTAGRAVRTEAPLLSAEADGPLQFSLASALYEAACESKDSRYSDAATLYLLAALRRQDRHGIFIDPARRHLPVCTRQISAALRGCVEAYQFTWDGRFLDAALRICMPLLRALRTDGFIPGQFDGLFQSASEWTALPASLEIAESWMMVFELTGEKYFLDAARRVTSYARRTLRLSELPDVRGAVRGSYPSWGRFERYRLSTEGATLFLSAQLRELRLISKQTRQSDLRLD